MKILISAKYVSGNANEGGSSRFMKCVADSLVKLEHEITYNATDKCDLAICSHDIIDNPAKKIFISHGIIDAERFVNGADRYISISNECKTVNDAYGFNSDVIPQPIKIGKRKKPNKKLKNILIIRRSEQLKTDALYFLNDNYNVKISDINIPIEKQIDWADLCITLGRGALDSMSRGKPVLVADNRNYIGAIGDGYVSSVNIDEIAKNNFSGRRFKIPITKKWVLGELKKYNSNDSEFLYNYVKENHDSEMIVKKYIEDGEQPQIFSKFAFGCMNNDNYRLNAILKNSSIGNVPCYTIENPEGATKGLNKLLDTIEKTGAEIGILTHNDMFYREHWLPSVKEQLSLLPENWVIAGIVGKDEKGALCGNFHDMSTPLWIKSQHDFPVECSCIDECTIIVNMKSGFRFDEKYEGWDLYGTYAALKAKEMGTAWIINAWAEHYCGRFKWEPSDTFKKMWKKLYDEFPNSWLDSTIVGKRVDGADYESWMKSLDNISKGE